MKAIIAALALGFACPVLADKGDAKLHQLTKSE